MSTQIQRAQKRVIDAFSNNIDVLRDVLPSHVKEQTIVRTLAQEIRKTPKLAECTSVSLFGAVVKACLLGLEVGSIKGHAYLIPYGNECQLIPGYQGYMWLAYNSKMVTSFQLRSVHAGDDFDFQFGTDAHVFHRPIAGERKFGLKQEGANTLTHAYAVAKLANGETMFDVMTRDEILTIKNKSTGAKKKESPWNDEQGAVEMAKKTVCRRLSKSLPLQVMQEVAGLDEAGEAEQGQHLGAFLEAEWEVLDEMDAAPEPPKSGKDKAKDALKNKEANAAKKPASGGGEQTASAPEPDTGQQSPPDASQGDPQGDDIPSKAEQMQIWLDECETAKHINDFLNKLADTAGITDADRELLEKAAHSKKEALKQPTE